MYMYIYTYSLMYTYIIHTQRKQQSYTLAKLCMKANLHNEALK